MNFAKDDRTLKRLTLAVIILIILLGLLLSTFPANAARAGSEDRLQYVMGSYLNVMNDEYGSDVALGRIKPLKDFDGNDYTLAECTPTGYMIMCNDAGVLMEYSASSPSPYCGEEGALYYGGSGMFFATRGEQLYDIFCETYYDVSIADDFVASSAELYQSAMAEKNDNIVAYLLGQDIMTRSYSLNLYGKNWTVVDNADFFRNKRTASQMSYYASGSTAYSGYVSASMLLGYYDTFKGYYGLVNSNYMTGSGVNRHFCSYNGKSFTEAYLVRLLNENGINHWSTSTQIRKVMNAYFDKHGSGLGSYDMIMPFFSGLTIKKQIDKNNPVILCGNIESPSTPSGGQSNSGDNDRAVLVYGYYKKSATKYAFLVHYAKAGYSESTINHYSSSTMGSMYIIN